MKKGQKMPMSGRKKLSEIRKGKPSSRKGAKLSDKTKQKIRLANIGKKLSEETKKKLSIAGKGRTAWNKGKRYSSPKQSLKMKGSNNSNWKGGISYELYSIDWTDDLRESIRKRDNHMCQECGIQQDELDGFHKKLDVHHIDYNKYNLSPSNLISLCKNCHAKTSFNREYWVGHFNIKTYG
jgi:hypothetical protein